MPSEKEITIYDIARMLNVSVATVSRALQDDPVVNKKTKKKVVEIAEATGYRSNHFARSLRTQRTHTIGVIVPRLNSFFVSTVIAGIEKIAHSEGYNLLISQSSESAQKEIANAKTMFNSRVDGLLVSLAYETENIAHFDPFFKKNIPLIFFDRVEEHEKCTNILIDNFKAGYEATAHLVAQGCKHIVHLTACTRRNVYVDRLRGYEKALQDNNITFSKEDVWYSNLTQEDGAAAAKAILQMNPLPDAVFAANDYCAVGCMIALKKRGIRIPEDVAFVGFNNDPVSGVIEPNLTTVNYPGVEMGEVAARSLINHLNGKEVIHYTNTILLRHELVVRQSSQKKLPGLQEAPSAVTG